MSEQRHAGQEPDLVARMTAMLKDLEQEVRLLKEGRTQEIRDNVPPTGHQDGMQPEGGSAVGGRANPQYLTLADVNALSWSKKGKNIQGSPSNSLGIPRSLQNFLANHTLRGTNPQSSILSMGGMEVLWNM